MLSVRLIPFALVLIALYALKRIIFYKKSNKLPLPPGPKGLPIVGNIRDLPPEGAREWEHWLTFKDRYGPISSITIFGQRMIIINEPQVALDLMERRSAIFSGRPELEFANRMCGWGDALATQQRGYKLRTARRYFHSMLGSKTAVSNLSLVQEIEVGRFLLRTLDRPSDLNQNIRTEAGAIILKATYDYNIEPHQRDALVDRADEAIRQFSAATTPGAWLVDTIPFLKHIPEWMPGAGFKRTARSWNKSLMELMDKPYRFAKHQMSRKDNQGSLLSRILQQAPGKGDITPEDENIIKWTAGSLYLAGADTTVSTLSCFFLAMTIWPEVQRKAQEEIDRVVGTDRLPTYEDQEKLPYIEAIVTEALRWHPVAPTGLPHRADEDSVYEGYLIPKRSTLIPNTWWFLHDPQSYPSPLVFNPERFLGEKQQPDPKLYCFGFGRRVCPGRLLAFSSVFLTIAQSLAAFNISKPLDKNGRVIEQKAEFTPGVVSHPTPFECDIKPRSPTYERLIRNVEKEHPWQESDAKTLEEV